MPRAWRRAACANTTPQHTAECGYTEGSEGAPCSHEHTENCYTLVTECVHEHGPECYPQESVEPAETEGATDDAAAPSEPKEQRPSACAHVCNEESGCITEALDCKHELDETCGYAPATEGTPCTYVCEICNPQDSGEAEETEPGAECICTGLCTEETVNAECPVCGAEDADLTACEGGEEETATASNAPMPLLPTAALAADENIDSNQSVAITTRISSPQIVNFFSSSSGQASATWYSVEGASSYTAYLYKQNDTENPIETRTATTSGTMSATTFTITSAGTYTFGVVANSSDGTASVESKWNNTLTFYKVTFDSKGGSEVSEQYAVANQNLSNPTQAPTKTGYAFGGWYRNEKYTDGPWDFDSDTVSTSDMTLYAKWLSTNAGVESVTVNDVQATDGENNTFSVTLPYGTEITSDTITINLADEKATVSGPQADENGNNKWTFTVTAEDGTTVENYTINVTFTPVASTLTVVPAEDTLTYGDKLEIKVTPGIAAANVLTTAENTVELINAAGDVLAAATQPDDNGAYTLTYNTQQKGLAIGENILTVSFGGDSGLNASTAEVTVTLEKVDVDATLDGTTSKTYDGTTAAPEGLLRLSF